MGDIRVDLRNRDAQSLTGDKFSSVNVESRGSSALTSAPREARATSGDGGTGKSPKDGAPGSGGDGKHSGSDRKKGAPQNKGARNPSPKRGPKKFGDEVRSSLRSGTKIAVKSPIIAKKAFEQVHSVTAPFGSDASMADVGGGIVEQKAINAALRTPRVARSSYRVGKRAVKKSIEVAPRVARITSNQVQNAARLTARVRKAGLKNSVKAAKKKIAKVNGKVAAKAVNRAAAAASRAVTQLIARIVAIIAVKMTALLIFMIPIIAVIVVVAIVLSFLPSWLGGYEEEQKAKGGAAGVVAAGMGDDYPYKGMGSSSANPDTGYFYGNCTDFAIWRVNRDDGVTKSPWKHVNSNTTPAGGHGYQWGNDSALPGWEKVSTPTPGDIISFQPGAQGGRWNASFGHVAYVGQVGADGSMVTENYGDAEYFLENYTPDMVKQLVSSGQAVIKHNPNSKLKIKTENGVTTVDNANYAAAGTSAGDAQAYAKTQMKAYGWDDNQFACLVELWNHESGWNYTADNPTSDAYGIPQALPGEKMASEGADWATNPQTQIRWGLKYIKDRPDYGSPCAAWTLWQQRSPHWY
ncbi:CHAP domain-containing protein [Actinomyces oris]|uniref:CHAP domain-containing protein n=1 Tax=Actinomyces oris TaxID=544580 RepID=A0AAW9KIP8_9ACTO|nr:CHAP domain-containing protein [Actinomyces oris]MEA1304960.1 CHAP domain-containing protein [Actinomyces oris]